MNELDKFLAEDDDPRIMVQNEEGGDIDLMDRVRLKVDVVSQEVFLQLWRQLSETIWVNNHDRGYWKDPGKLADASYMTMGAQNIVNDDDAEAQARAMAKVVYRIMDVAHMHSLPVAQALLDYSIEQQMRPAEEEDATISE